MGLLSFVGDWDDENLAPTDIEILGMCVELASLHSERIIPKTDRRSPEDYIYWHTREKCAEKAIELKLGISDLVREISKQERRGNTIGFLSKHTKKFWIDVCHPYIIVEGVLNS